MDEQLRAAAADAHLHAGIWNPDAATEQQRFKALVFDATGIKASEQLTEAWAFLHPTIRRVLGSGRVIVLGTPPEDCESPAEAIAQRALEGLVRAVGKELRRGATAQLLYVASGRRGRARVDACASSSRRARRSSRARWSGSARRRRPTRRSTGSVPLAGKVALVTGAARGIGAAIAQVLARDGAHVVGLDVPAMSSELTSAMASIGGSVLAADITADAGADRDRRRTCSSTTAASTSSSTTPA